MESIRTPLARLVEALQWFVVADEVRLLHVLTSTDAVVSVFQHIAAAEHDPRNKSPIVILQTPADTKGERWNDRADELRADFEELRKTLGEAERPIALPALPPPARAQTPLVRFASELAAASRSLQAPLEGLIVVLAPSEVEQTKGWLKDLQALIRHSEPLHVRWIVVDQESPLSEPVRQSMGGAADFVDARIDPEAAQRDIAKMLAVLQAAPPGAKGPQLAGGAGPPVVPPARKGEPPAPSAEQRAELARQAEVPEALFDPEAMKGLRVSVLSASQAMREGNWQEAVRRQAEARDFCAREGLGQQAVVMELVLGGYALQGGAFDLATDAFRQARRRADEGGFADQAVQAQLALGSTFLLRKQPDEAARAYEEAGQLGETNGARVLGIEGFRMAGQLHASHGREESAAAAWRRAVHVAEETPPEQSLGSTAPEAARALAKLCRKRGMTAQADSLEAQATALEAAQPDSDAPKTDGCSSDGDGNHARGGDGAGTVIPVPEVPGDDGRERRGA